MMYVPDSNLVQDLDESELAAPKHSTAKLNPQPEPIPEQPGPHVSISTTKVNSQLELLILKDTVCLSKYFLEICNRYVNKICLCLKA